MARTRSLLPVVGAVSGGGALGAVARYTAGLAWPTTTAAFPWTTLVVNTLGCAAIGLLMVNVVERWPHRRLLRPFWGTGVLGGFTTFSTYAVDVQHLASSGRWATATAYLVLTPVLAVLAAALTARAGRRLIDRSSP